MTANLSSSTTQSTSASGSATASAAAATASWQERNSQLLAVYVRERSIDSRNAVVRANLPLIWQAARRESQRSGHSFEDLSQVGCLGLIKAVERFDLGRGASLSSAAMPWIIGAMRQHLRDRCQPLRASRTLHELTLRAHQLQQQRLQQQMPPLNDAELPQALGCSPARWQEARGLQQALRLASLDQPQLLEESESLTLQDQLVDPASADRYAGAIRSERRRLLWRALRRLERTQRRLLLGRVLQQRAWGELGAQFGLSAKVTQRRFAQLLELLRQQLGPDLASDLA